MVIIKGEEQFETLRKEYYTETASDLDAVKGNPGDIAIVNASGAITTKICDINGEWKTLSGVTVTVSV